MTNKALDGNYTHGRTVTVEDPVLKCLEYLDGNKQIFTSDAQQGIIVSDDLLKGLGYSDLNVKEIYCFHKNTRGAIPIVKIVKAKEGQDPFFIPEGFRKLMVERKWEPNPMLSSCYLGPLEPESLEVTTEKVKKFLEEQEINVEVVKREDSKKWLKLKHAKESWPRDYWRNNFFPGLYKALESEVQIKSYRIDFEHKETELTDTTTNEYANVTVYISDIDFLLPVANYITKKVKLSIMPGILEIFMKLHKFSILTMTILVGVLSIVTLISCLTIYLVFRSSIELKTFQIGMLMAQGTSQAILFGIYFLESAFVCMIASTLSIPLSLLLGRSVVEYLKRHFEYRGLVFELSPSLVLIVIAATILTSSISTLIAIFFKFREEPGKLLRS